MGSQNSVITETITQQESQASEPLKLPDNEALKKAVKSLTEEGYSDSKIIKEVLGYQGSQYQQGKEMLAAMRRDDG